LVAAIVLAAFTPAVADTPQTITRHVTPADRERDRFVYVPFEVPAGTTELRVRYQYDRANGQNTIDIGVFEPGSLALGTAAMRGYSGGSRTEFRIAEHAATPGYKAGPLPAGRWHVMLGLYAVADAGADVTITVELGTGNSERGTRNSEPRTPNSEPGTRNPEREPERERERERGSRNPEPGTSRWWPGALHTHTLHSDGAVSATELLARIRKAGLDFVTITDHNNTTHIDEVVGGRHPTSTTPLWIVGEEVTTPAGHANVWGLDPGEWVDFRVRPNDRGIDNLVATAHQHGALFSINHPSSECVGCSWEQEVPHALDAIEVWNGRHGAQDKAIALWERLLLEGRRVTAVGASDWHRDPDPVDTANVRVFAPDLSERSILDAIRSARVVVMRSAADRTPTFTVRTGGETATVGGSLTASGERSAIEIHAPGVHDGRVVFVINGVRLTSVPVGDGAPARLDRTLEPGFVRAEIYAADGALVALTNPVFITR
jgi:hypothetical protein